MTRVWADPPNLDPYGWRAKVRQTPLSPSLKEMVDRTNRLAEECKERGHVKSGQTVMRFLGGNLVAMDECARCKIPQHGAGKRSPYAPQW